MERLPRIPIPFMTRVRDFLHDYVPWLAVGATVGLTCMMWREYVLPDKAQWPISETKTQPAPPSPGTPPFLEAGWKERTRQDTNRLAAQPPGNWLARSREGQSVIKPGRVQAATPALRAGAAGLSRPPSSLSDATQN
jgi:hypothetical protein